MSPGQYNSVRPFTKVRFVQDPEEDLLTDFLFTQNIARGLNLMAAFDRTVTNGNYANAALDAWNVRIRFRYNISDRVNISISDFYTKAVNGLNYGVILNTSAYIPSDATENNSSTFDIRSRQDLTFAAIGRLLPDSASTTRLNLFYTNTYREYDSSGAANILEKNSAVVQGYDLRQDLRIPFMRLNFGYQQQKTARRSIRSIILCSGPGSIRSICSGLGGFRSFAAPGIRFTPGMGRK